MTDDREVPDPFDISPEKLAENGRRLARQRELDELEGKRQSATPGASNPFDGPATPKVPSPFGADAMRSIANWRAKERTRVTDEGHESTTDKVVEQAGLIVGGRRASLDAASTTRPLIRTFADYDPTAPRPPVEAVLRRTDGATVIAARRTTWLSGLPGAGKSWIALMAIVDHCSRGGRALIIDGEMSWNRIAERLALLPDHRPAMEGLAAYAIASEVGNRQPELAAWVEADDDEQLPGLVIVDSARATGAPADGSNVEPWIDELIEPYRATGCSVIVIDHIPKRSHDRPAGPIGSQAKLAMADAALLITGKAWSKVSDGRVKLTIEKDRDGDLPGAAGDTIATVAGTWRDTDDGPAFDLRVEASTAADELLGEPDSDELQDAIMDAIWKAPAGLNMRELRSLVKGSNRKVKVAADALVESGQLVVHKASTGHRYTVSDSDEATDGPPF